MPQERPSRRGKKYVGIDIPARDFAMLSAIAASQDSTVSREVRLAIHEYLDRKITDESARLLRAETGTQTPEEQADAERMRNALNSVLGEPKKESWLSSLIHSKTQPHTPDSESAGDDMFLGIGLQVNHGLVIPKQGDKKDG